MTASTGLNTGGRSPSLNPSTGSPAKRRPATPKKNLAAALKVARTNIPAFRIRELVDRADIICIADYHLPDCRIFKAFLYNAIRKPGDRVVYEARPIAIRKFCDDGRPITPPHQERWDRTWSGGPELLIFAQSAQEHSMKFLHQLSRPNDPGNCPNLKEEVSNWVRYTRQGIDKRVENLIHWSATRTIFLKDTVEKHCLSYAPDSGQRLIVSAGAYHLAIVEGVDPSSQWSLIRPPSHPCQENSVRDLWQTMEDQGRSYVVLERKFDKTDFFKQLRPIFHHLEEVLKSPDIDLDIVVPDMQSRLKKLGRLEPYEQVMLAKLQVEILARCVFL